MTFTHVITEQSPLRNVNCDDIARFVVALDGYDSCNARAILATKSGHRPGGLKACGHQSCPHRNFTSSWKEGLNVVDR